VSDDDAGAVDAPAPAGVDLVALRPFFREHVPGSAGGPLTATLIKGGRSNLTYVIREGELEWVLRRPPLGHVLPTAHDMRREYQVLGALVGTDVPVPEPLAFCADDSVVGAPFYVMRKVDGLVVRTSAEAQKLTAEEARAASDGLVEVLVRIHAVDPVVVGLEGFGRPHGYLERQVRRWSEQLSRSKTRDLPALDEVARRLRAALPPEAGAGIVHGDYKLDNTILDPSDLGRVRAVLDWEMATLGDPLADLGLWLVYLSDAGAQVSRRSGTPRSNPGFLGTAELTEAYARASGRDLSALDFYVVLGFFKLAVIAEGITARFLAGRTVGDDGQLGSNSAGLDEIAASVPYLAEAALDVARGSSLAGLRS
jgi:aminoglycoside phosphotransferase (APT) family kinase protein